LPTRIVPTRLLLRTSHRVVAPSARPAASRRPSELKASTVIRPDSGSLATVRVSLALSIRIVPSVSARAAVVSAGSSATALTPAWLSGLVAMLSGEGNARNPIRLRAERLHAAALPSLSAVIASRPAASTAS